MANKTKQIKIKYNGIGASKSNIHTKKQFLKIAKKHFSDCPSKKCKNNKSCKLRNKYAKKIKKGEYLDGAEYFKASEECNKCKKKHECNLKEYIKYSGATSTFKVRKHKDQRRLRYGQTRGLPYYHDSVESRIMARCASPIDFDAIRDAIRRARQSLHRVKPKAPTSHRFAATPREIDMEEKHVALGGERQPHKSALIFNFDGKLMSNMKELVLPGDNAVNNTSKK